MNAQHTPGPWNVVNTTPSNALDIAVIFDADSQVVCSIPKGSSSKPQQERRANARLIAAAPELLEALVALVDISDSDGLICWPRLVNEARAAITAARGQA